MATTEFLYFFKIFWANMEFSGSRAVCGFLCFSLIQEAVNQFLVIPERCLDPTLS